MSSFQGSVFWLRGIITDEKAMDALSAIPNLKIVLKEKRAFEQVTLLVVLIRKQENVKFRFRAAKSA
ncbi:MAG: hypothetical protein ACOY0R_11525 [Chloroflexota bacterium]